MAKITPNLAQHFEALDGDEPIDVVLELGDDAAEALEPADNPEQMRSRFAGVAEPVKRKIRLLGGHVTGEGWLNGTLQARLTRRAVERLDDPSVARVDLPRILERE